MQFIAPYQLVSSANLALHFHPLHIADLRASGLRDETIRAAGVYSLAPSLIAQFFSARRGVPAEIQSALCFPYQRAQFARIKLFPPLGKMKYAQPADTGARLYRPFAVDDLPLFICEGEKKTLAAYQAGLNSVGIGGVWNWLSNSAPIADFEFIQWDGREVTVIPDSDVFSRRDLLHAIYALGWELQSRGASVYVAQIPQLDTEKIGLDDFLVAGGRVESLDVFSLGHTIFKPCSAWHSRWKFKRALMSKAA